MNPTRGFSCSKLARDETGSLLTYEDYVKIPEDGLRHEIIEGRHIVSPSPRTRHQVVVGNIHLVLAALGRDATPIEIEVRA